MPYTDNELTRRMAEWLQTPPAERDLRQGAEMTLALTRNKALYNAAIRKPLACAEKLEYEIRKHLAMRLDGVTAAGAARMEAEVMPRAATVAASGVPVPEPEIDSADELPAGDGSRRGRRPDHDSLPPDVRALWDSNGPRYRGIVLLFNELKAMGGLNACDRYEKVRLLAEADAAYRRALREYDSYRLPAEAEAATANES